MFIFIFIFIETWYAHKHKYRLNFKYYLQRSFQLVRRIISVHHWFFVVIPVFAPMILKNYVSLESTFENNY